MSQLFNELIQGERNGEAVVRAASLRSWIESHTGVMHNRKWAKHKRNACVTKRQKISRFRAVQIWVSVLRQGKLESMDLVIATREFIQRFPKRVEAFLADTVCQGFTAGGLAHAVQGLVPGLPDIIWRSTLAGWCDRAGFQFTAASSYTPQQVIKVATVAAQGIGQGRPRGGISMGDLFF